jgi:hypothetical protein
MLTISALFVKGKLSSPLLSVNTVCYGKAVALFCISPRERLLRVYKAYGYWSNFHAKINSNAKSP